MAIVLTPELLKSQAGQMQSLMNQYDSLFRGVTSTLNQVNSNWSENLSNNFSSKIVSAQKSFSGILDTLEFGATAANNSAQSFSDIDSQLAKILGAGGVKGAIDIASSRTASHSGSSRGGHSSGKAKHDKKKLSWWDEVKKQAMSGARAIKTGAAKAVKTVKNVTSKVVDAYNEKGLFWKAVQTGKAVVSIAGAFAASAAAWGLTAGSAGVGTPLASLVTVYSANTVANSFSDLINCWFGDKEQVGEVNALKSIDEVIFGEKVGDIVYNVGAVTAVAASVTAFSGSLKQAPDMAQAIKGSVGEVGKGASGVVGVAGDVLTGKIGLQEAGYQIHMLSTELPHLTDLGTCFSVLHNIAKDTKKVSEAVVKTIYEAVNHESYDPSSAFAQMILKEDTPEFEAYKVIKSVKEATEVFSNDNYQPLTEAHQADQLG